MRVLIVCSYKEKMPEGCVPFIREQVAAIRDYLNREDCRLEIEDWRMRLPRLHIITSKGKV